MMAPNHFSFPLIQLRVKSAGYLATVRFAVELGGQVSINSTSGEVGGHPSQDERCRYKGHLAVSINSTSGEVGGFYIHIHMMSFPLFPLIQLRVKSAGEAYRLADIDVKGFPLIQLRVKSAGPRCTPHTASIVAHVSINSTSGEVGGQIIK